MELIETILSIDPNYWIIGLLAVFFTLEQILDNPFVFKKRGAHLLQNLLLQVVFVLLNIFFLALLVFGIEWFNNQEIGLFYLLSLPYVVQVLLGVVLFDFATYWLHRASHKSPLLWRLHRVHHSDTTMDSSTTFRFHPLELALVYQAWNLITAAIFGLDVTTLALYYFMVYIFFFLEHSNLKYPKWLNTTIGLIFVMPDHHRVHHHQEQFYTDSNFADIFILWDRIFGTFKLLPVHKIKYGLVEFKDPKKQSFLYLLKSPFILMNTTKKK
ncbi:sterol desaturase family protein [Croceivirga sp. JEA036]|uniref:sterol desaturase family protein n=1 Tax=Croceivirga sp. JEA036 TaxID=2721162 RepID=UPI00143B9BE9|nr:sterol desaturase family protein [Croceivirga sp. JEA036]NJB35283.1 sterol desaturase family protein [Croceivirga sp. JEA036]